MHMHAYNKASSFLKAAAAHDPSKIDSFQIVVRYNADGPRPFEPLTVEVMEADMPDVYNAISAVLDGAIETKKAAAQQTLVNIKDDLDAELAEHGV